MTKDVTLTAKWTKNTVTPTPDNGNSTGEVTKYTVTFSTNGGTAVASQKIESGKTATEPASPTKEGFTFGGWFTDSNFTTAFTFSTAIKSDITLYAKWIESSKPTCTVIFSTDGAETKQTIAEGGKVSKPTDPTKTGYTFDGWYKDDTKFDFETTLTTNLTLTAKWTPITYTITYEGLNGAANPNTATSYTVESETITLQNPTRTGYIFNGWFDAETGGNKIESIAKGSTEAKTLYAQWSAISYEITYVLRNGVTNPNTVTSYTVETETITLQDFSHDDYTFEGWFDAETGGNKVTSIPKGSTGNKTLYAHCTWKWIGTKNPTTAKAVGDIVFNDGSATPYSANLTLTDAQKTAAIALIFYKGTGLNSGDDTTTSRTLGVGLKHNKSKKLEWCLDSANAYSKNITTIQCPASGSAGALTFTGDRNGSDNLEQIAAFDGVYDTATAAKYPAFYFAKNYKTSATNIAGTDYESGWYLPSIAELFQIYANGKGENKVFDIDAASEALGGDKFETSSYWSSSQYDSRDDSSYRFNFNDRNKAWYYKDYYIFYACAVRAF